MKKSILISSLIFIFLEIFFVFFLYQSYQKNLKDHLKNVGEHSAIVINSVYKMNEASANVFMSEAVCNEKVLNLFSCAFKADNSTQNIIRDSLYKILLPSYKRIEKFNYQQLHFHLPDNTSFLRFHRKEKFGDNLTDFRPTVKYVNEFKKNATGFEEGRIFNGFRYVFPLFYDNKHIGSAEISFSCKAIIESIDKQHLVVFDFILLKKVVTSHVFKSEQNNYVESKYSSNFLTEIFFEDSINKTKILEEVNIEDFKNKVSKINKLDEKLKKFNTFSENINYKNKLCIVSFVPIKNFENIPVAYFVSFNFDEEYSYTINSYKTYLVIVSFFIFGLVCFFSYLIVSRKTEILNRKNIEKQNETINIMLSELDIKNAELNKANSTKDKFFSILAHDLINPFNQIIGFSSIIKNNIEENNLEKAKQFTDIVNKTGNKTYILLKNILDWSRSHLNSIKYSPENINLYEIVVSEIESFIQIINQKNIEIQNFIPENYTLFADKNMISAIIRNLTANAVKYTRKNGIVKFNVDLIERNYHISVADNGVGMNSETIEKLINQNEFFSTPGTENESGNGLGFTLCKEFIQMHSGKIIIESKIDEGSKFIVIIPENSNKLK